MDNLQGIKGELIVSCQALEKEPLHSSFIMGRMALAAKEGGSVAGYWDHQKGLSGFGSIYYPHDERSRCAQGNGSGDHCDGCDPQAKAREDGAGCVLYQG